MERIRLVKSTEMGKEKSRKISSKQLEAKITAYTILLAVIVMNILWWTGTQFLELNNNHNITKMQVPSIKNLCNINNTNCIFNKNQHFVKMLDFYSSISSLYQQNRQLTCTMSSQNQCLLNIGSF